MAERVLSWQLDLSLHHVQHRDRNFELDRDKNQDQDQDHDNSQDNQKCVLSWQLDLSLARALHHGQHQNQAGSGSGSKLWIEWGLGSGSESWKEPEEPKACSDQNHDLDQGGEKGVIKENVELIDSEHQDQGSRSRIKIRIRIRIRSKGVEREWSRRM